MCLLAPTILRLRLRMAYLAQNRQEPAGTMSDIDATIFEFFPCDQHIYCSWVTIETTVLFSQMKRALIQHNNSRFIWVNGTEHELPYLIIPLRESDKDDLYEYSKSTIYDDALDYLSLLSFITGRPVDINMFTFKNYRAQWHRVLEYNPPFIPRAGTINTGGLEKPPIFTAAITDKDKHIYGLFREALSSNSMFYSMLACHKVFEHIFPDKDDKIDFFDTKINAAWENYSRQNMIRGFGDPDKFRQFVRHYGGLASDYLRKKCRHAIAHSKPGEHFITPYKYSDYYEMYFANETMKALTLYLIMDKISA